MPTYGSSRILIPKIHGPSGPDGAIGDTGATGATGITGSVGPIGPLGIGITTINGITLSPSDNNILVVTLDDGTIINISGIKGETGSFDAGDLLGNYAIENKINSDTTTAIIFKERIGVTAHFKTLNLTGNAISSVSGTDTIIISGVDESVEFGGVTGSVLYLKDNGSGLSAFYAENIMFHGGTGIVLSTLLHENKIPGNANISSIDGNARIIKSLNFINKDIGKYIFSEERLDSVFAGTIGDGLTFSYGGYGGQSNKYISSTNKRGTNTSVNDSSYIYLDNLIWLGLSASSGASIPPSITNLPDLPSNVGSVETFAPGTSFTLIQSHAVLVSPDRVKNESGATFSFGDIQLGSCCYCAKLDTSEETITPDTTCIDYVSKKFCDSFGGFFKENTKCQLRLSEKECNGGSSCCVNGKCVAATKSVCENQYGGFHVPDFNCDEIESLGGCQQECLTQIGACCLDGTCYQLTQHECSLLDNTVFVQGIPCEEINCCLEANFVGACCVDKGCFDGMTPVACAGITSADGSAGIFWGVGSSCVLTPNRESVPPYDCSYDPTGFLPPCIDDSDGGLGYGLVLMPDGSLNGCCVSPLSASNSPVLRVVQSNDYNNDGSINSDDLSFIIGRWDQGNKIADVNGDGKIDAKDLQLILMEWKNEFPSSDPTKSLSGTLKRAIDTTTINKSTVANRKRKYSIDVSDTGTGRELNCITNPLVDGIKLGDKYQGGYFVGYIGKPGPSFSYPGDFMIGSTPACMENKNCGSGAFKYTINCGKTSCSCDHTLPMNVMIPGIDDERSMRSLVNPSSQYGGNRGTRDSFDRYIQNIVYGTSIVKNGSNVSFVLPSGCSDSSIKIHRRWALIVSDDNALDETGNSLLEWGMIQSASVNKNGRVQGKYVVGTCAYDGLMNTRMFDKTSIDKGVWFESNDLRKGTKISLNSLLKNKEEIFEMFHHTNNIQSFGWNPDVTSSLWVTNGSASISSWRNDFRNMWESNNPIGTATREISRINETGKISNIDTRYKDWYIPSSVELGAIRAAVDNGLNRKILLGGGTQLSGNYWTSTTVAGDLIRNIEPDLNIKSHAHSMIYQDFTSGALHDTTRRFGKLLQLRPVRRVPVYTLEIDTYYRSEMGKCTDCRSSGCDC